MAIRKAVKGTAVIASGGLVAFYGLTKLTEYRKKQARLSRVEAVEQVNMAFQDELPSRQAQLMALRNTQEFDVLVVGGGATGSGCALDAVTRNLKTALVERDDFSSGTSSRSTKLIHGGVRYLQKAIVKLDYEQYMMVKEALHERSNLLNIAPHLTALLPIMLPIYKWWQLPYYWAGIKIYDLVAGAQCLKSSYILTKTKALELFPMLKKDKLVGAIVYYDGQHNDARMNLAIALTAARYGAAIANYTEVVHLLKRVDPQMGKERVCGAHCRDVITGQEFDVRAKCVINATGPFTDALRKMDDQKNPNICQPSAGVHIVIPGYYSPDNMGLLDPATSDGRVIFFLPWEKMTIAGTTDTPTEITPHPIPMEEDINFILTEVRNYLSPDVEVRRGDVLAAWSGIRPLVTNPNSKDTQSICRNHIVHISDSGLVTIAGGKWTTYRSMAEDTLDAAVKAHNLSAGPSKTVGLMLEGAKDWTPTMYIRLVQDYGLEVEEELSAAKQFLYYEMGYKARSEQLTDTSEITLTPAEVGRYMKRFHKFDKENKGFITTVDVQRVLESINVYIDAHTLHEILNEVDLNKNGQVEFNEFLQLMSAVKKGQVSANRLAILMKTAEQSLDQTEPLEQREPVDQRKPVSVDRSGGGV
ncbi:glycerol-3-phosphate dehydrogenase, mitochondrial-like isoform X4 [Salvelinus fontinalis]|uniref:glycerol-3-phosphate dehydrogenase, mitochondrial-like isoform X4 n=1 Tax=Salvelinus fontinalis TaxID=8038 RepID=UPI002485FF1E|nr:glycerol-3-phosphate dehydrogenase, mitochondrial-like isoform X4 [Salvelinus fontinalis]